MHAKTVLRNTFERIVNLAGHQLAEAAYHQVVGWDERTGLPRLR